jgi:hypothetical protein
MEIKIIKLAKIDWRSLLILQNPEFKEMSNDEFNKLKNSLRNNDFIDPFKVWQADEGIYCLDGKHRVDALKSLIEENVIVPDKLPALFIDCPDKKTAAKYVLIFSSRYARITYEGMYEFLHIHGIKEDFDDIAAMTDIPDIDLPMFYLDYMTDIQPDNFNAENIERLAEGQPKMIECPNCGFKFEKSKDYSFGKKEYESRPAEIKE